MYSCGHDKMMIGRGKSFTVHSTCHAQCAMKQNANWSQRWVALAVVARWSPTVTCESIISDHNHSILCGVGSQLCWLGNQPHLSILRDVAYCRLLFGARQLNDLRKGHLALLLQVIARGAPQIDLLACRWLGRHRSEVRRALHAWHRDRWAKDCYTGGKKKGVGRQPEGSDTVPCSLLD